MRDRSGHTLYSSGIDITTQTDSDDDEMCALMLGEVLKNAQNFFFGGGTSDVSCGKIGLEGRFEPLVKCTWLGSDVE